MELTKEYFDQHLGQLNKRLDGIATREDLKSQLELQSEELKAYANKAIDDLARDILQPSFENIENRLIDHENRLIHLEEKIDNLPTKAELFGQLGNVSVILYRLDQERLFTAEWIRRIETDVISIKAKLI